MVMISMDEPGNLLETLGHAYKLTTALLHSDRKSLAQALDCWVFDRFGCLALLNEPLASLLGSGLPACCAAEP